jgi:hypothetical protein
MRAPPRPVGEAARIEPEHASIARSSLSRVIPKRTGPAVAARRRRGPRIAGGLVGVLVAGLLVAACGGSAATFSPSGACLVDGRSSGAYPELEGLLPTSLIGVAPTNLDSGRDCSDTTLGSLTSHGVSELRFAGATWDEGGGNGTSIAVLALPAGEANLTLPSGEPGSGSPGLPAPTPASTMRGPEPAAALGDLASLPVAWVEEFYTVGAINGGKTSNVTTNHVQLDDAGTVFRLDTLNDLSQQSIVVWQDGPVVRVVIVATQVDPSASMAQHDARVLAAVEAAHVAPHAGT